MFKHLCPASLGIRGREGELIELSLSHGFKGFDLDIEQFHRQVERNGLARARRLFDSARLNFGWFRLPVDFDGDDPAYGRELERLGVLAELAAQVGCQRCRATVPPAGDVRPYHESFELYRRRFGEIAAVLAPHDIRLGIDFVAPASRRRDRAFQFIHTFDELLHLVHGVDAENVGLALDVWHWHVSGGRMEQIEALDGSAIVALDLADATTTAGDDNAEEDARELPGTSGEIDAAAILAVLVDRGFDGPVSPVAHRSRFQAMKDDQIAATATAALDEVFAAAGLSKSGKPLRTGSRAGGR